MELTLSAGISAQLLAIFKDVEAQALFSETFDSFVTSVLDWSNENNHPSGHYPGKMAAEVDFRRPTKQSVRWIK